MKGPSSPLASLHSWLTLGSHLQLLRFGEGQPAHIVPSRSIASVLTPYMDGGMPVCVTRRLYTRNQWIPSTHHSDP